MRPNRYADDVLAAAERPKSPPAPEVEARQGLVVEERASGFTGDVVGVEKGFVRLRDRHGRSREFPLQPRAFAIDGRPVTLVPPVVAAPTGPRTTASGSIAAAPAPARVAQPSRIFVEGVHDAALVEKVWGDDLRELGIPVEVLEGVDDLPGIVRAFAPRPGRRLGILVDHLLPGTKEWRVVEALRRGEGAEPGALWSEHVLVTGHPYVDIWQGVRPKALGIEAWPVIPKGQPWKEGVCAALGVADPPTLWRRILGAVSTYADLETPLVGAVEQLIDFVTE
jgi:hypothetical protein